MNQKMMDARDNAILAYSILCGVALVGMFWAFTNLGTGFGGLFPIAIGLVSMLVRWRLGSAMLLLTLAVLLLSKRIYFRGVDMVSPSSLPDLVLCASVMAYVAGHYRLLGCVNPLFPPLPRKIKPEIGTQRQEAGDIPHPSALTPHASPLPARAWGAELAGLLLMIPVCAGWAAFIGGWLWQQRPQLGLPRGLWQLVLLIWLVGVVFFVMTTVFRYWRHRRLTEEEASLILQDVLWQETRAEQRRINYWLAWARSRARKRKDIP